MPAFADPGTDGQAELCGQEGLEGDSHDDRGDGQVGEADGESDGQFVQADADPEPDERQPAAAAEAAGFLVLVLVAASSIQAPTAITAAPAR
jgi:hypothetical protein